MVLTTIRGHDVIIVQDEETFEEAIERVWNEVCYVSVGFIGSDGWYGADGYPLIVHPIAWMPLPKPYRKTESNSEKPNNCEECEHWNDTEDGCADRHGCKTEPTISKMEQVEDEPQTDCKDCKYAWWNSDAKRYECSVEKCPYTQTDCAWGRSE